MPSPTATISSDTADAKRMTKTIERQLNGTTFLTGDANLRRPVDSWVYIFNVSPIEHKIWRPWVSEMRMGQGIILPPPAEGEEYGKPFQLPEILQEVTPRIQGGSELVTRGVDGKFYAQDALYPDQPNGDWKTYRPLNSANSMSGGEGTNLYKLGCFWTTQNPPEPEAVAKARERLEETFNAEVRNATNLALQGKNAEITNLQHIAAEYLHVDVEWHKKYRAKMECPGCGEFVNAGIARHMAPECRWVFNWDKALAGGQATMEEAVAAGVRKAQKSSRGETEAQ